MSAHVRASLRMNVILNLADRRLPGAAGGVISVGSSNKLHQGSYFSNIGRTVDVVAPGEDIVGLEKGKPIALNGTSFSAPMVAGVVALMLAADPLLSWKHIEYILKKTATPMSCDDYCPENISGMTQSLCLDYCCVDGVNVCARGIVNAKAAVTMAQAGFPNTALVDVDDYFIALSDDNNLSATITIKNWGKKTGVMRARMSDKNLKMWPATLNVPPITKDGVPGQATTTIFYDGKPHYELVLSLVIEAANKDNPDDFHDDIEAIVSIVPDPRRPKKKIFRKLFSAGK